MQQSLLGQPKEKIKKKSILKKNDRKNEIDYLILWCEYLCHI